MLRIEPGCFLEAGQRLVVRALSVQGIAQSEPGVDALRVEIDRRLQGGDRRIPVTLRTLDEAQVEESERGFFRVEADRLTQRGESGVEIRPAARVTPSVIVDHGERWIEALGLH